MIFRARDDDDGFNESSWLGKLTYPFHALVHAIGRLFRTDDSLQVERSFISRVMGVVTFPFRLVIGFLAFLVQSWANSRSGFAFIKGLPAVMGAGLFFAGLLAADLIMTEGKRIASTAAYMNFQVNNAPDHPEFSMIFADKLVELNSDNPESIYQLGLAYSRMKDYVRAVDAMSSIAGDNTAGYPPAHVWRSQYYRGPECANMDLETRELQARKHLAFAVEVDPENQAANFDLAALHQFHANRLTKGSPEYEAAQNSAIECLDKVLSEQRTGYYLLSIAPLARLRMETGDEESARQLLNSEVVQLETDARRQPDNRWVWETLVKCAILLEDYDLAVSIVSDCQRLSNDATIVRSVIKTLSQAFILKANGFRDMSNRMEYSRRLAALSRSLVYDPTNAAPYEMLLDYISDPDRLNEDPESIDFSKADEIWLKDAVVSTMTPGPVHAMLGIREISRGNVRSGEKHWRMAAQHSKDIQIVINNLIDVAVNKRPDEFANLLDMITLGIELFPDHPVFYQTRGVYHLKQGRLQEAVADLEYAREKLPNSMTVNTYLVDCYEKLGDSEKAAEQQLLVEEKLNKLSAEERKRIEAFIERMK